MAPEERSDIVDVLEDSRQVFNAAAGGISEAHAKTSPETGRWSVLECVEHVTFVEGRFLARLEQAERLKDMHVDKQKEGELVARVASRANRVVAPEMAWPTGRFTSLAEAIDEFNAARTRTMRFAQDRGADLYWLAAEHPRFGPMNGAEMMMVIAGHARRHAEQIREIRTALNAAP